LDGEDTNRTDWRYTDGTVWNYTNWHPGQPDDQGDIEHCLSMVGPATVGHLQMCSTFNDPLNLENNMLNDKLWTS
jgi:hypothetical protein